MFSIHIWQTGTQLVSIDVEVGADKKQVPHKCSSDVDQDNAFVTPDRMCSQILEPQFVMPTRIALFIKLVQLTIN